MFGVQQSQSPSSMLAFDVAPTRSSAGAGGDTWASWLLGYPSLIQRIHFPIHPENRTYEPSMFVQDDWRATSWLTVNLGLRYEIFTPTTEVEDQMSVFNPEAGKIVVAGRDTTRRAASTPTTATSGRASGLRRRCRPGWSCGVASA